MKVDSFLKRAAVVALGVVFASGGAWADGRAFSLQSMTYDGIIPASATLSLGEGAAGVTNVIAICWDAEDKGEDFDDWANHKFLIYAPPEMTSATCEVPREVKSCRDGSVKALRFFLVDGTPYLPSANTYVTDGLLAHFDGLENVAYGAAHDSTTNKWTDLTGNGYNWSLGSICSWEDNALYFSGKGGGGWNAKSAASDWSGVRTMEIVYKADVMQGVLFTTGINNALYSYVRNDKLAVTYNWGYAVDSTRIYTFSAVYNADDLVAGSGSFTGQMYRDGDPVTAVTMGAQWNTGGVTAIGERNGGGGTGAGSNSTGHMYALRFYSRQLTPAEIVKNNEIDRIRYFGAISLSDVSTLGVTVPSYFGEPCVLYVREDGDDAKAVKGDVDHPYGTVNGAMAAAGVGEVVDIGAGTFPLTAAVTLDRDITVRGAGSNETFITKGATGIRAFELSHDDAVLKDLAISGFVNDLHGAGISMTKGLVDRCRITYCGPDGLPSPCGGGINMSGGTVRASTIDHCDVDACSQTRYGGGIFMTGGTVEDCDFIANVGTLENANGRGSALYVSKGIVRRCRFVGNKNNDINSDGGALYCTGSEVTVERCRFEDNVPLAANLGSGKMYNCVVSGGANNQAFTAGVTLSGGRLCNCTFYGNVAGKDATGCSALTMTSGTAVNNIFYGNGGAAGGESVTGGTFNTNIVDSAVSRGVGNFAADPQFADAAAGNFTLKFGSAAIDAAEPLAEVTTDYAGTVRPQGEKPDIGAYEYVDDGTFKVGVRFSKTGAPAGGSVDMTAVVSGTATAYAWYTNDVLVAGQTEATCTLTDLPSGSFVAKVVVTDADGNKHTSPVSSAFGVSPIKVYVDDDSEDPTYPYDTPGKAARTIPEALSALWMAEDVTGEVVVAAGTYTLAASVTLSLPVKVIGAGRDVVTITKGKDGDRAFNLGHKGAELAGVKLTGFKNALYGGAISMSAGLVRDCTIEKCVHSGREQCGGGIYMTGGKLLRCIVQGNDLSALGGFRRGAGIYMSDGTVEDCDILDNTTGTSNSNDQGEGVYLAGGTVRNCRLSGNKGAATETCSAAVYLTGSSSLLENCIITNNHPLGVSTLKGIVRNCVIANNSGSSTAPAGVNIAGGAVYHCTVYGNVASGDATGCSGLQMTSGTAINNVFWKNGGSLGGCKVTGGTFNTNLVDNAVAVGVYNRAVDPGYKGASTNDFRLSFGSPAIDKGAAVGIDRDIAGTERPLGDGPDLGAYEYVPGSEFSVGLQVNPAECGAGDPVTLTAVVSGEAKTYAWYVDEVSVGTEKEITLTTLVTGAHDVRLVVTDANDVEHEAKQPSAVTVKPVKVYVATDGKHIAPYDALGKAATNLEDAVNALWQSASATTTVEVAAGEYRVSAEIALGTPVKVIGAGADVTTIRQKKTGCRAFSINSADAEVAGFTFDGFKTDDDGHILKMSKGLVRDCRLVGCGVANYPYDRCGGAVHMTGGTIRRCELSGNRMGGGGARRGAAIYMTSGLVEDCDIFDNSTGTANSNDQGEGVYLAGGTLRNCRIHDNFGRSDQSCSAGVYVTGADALVENCVIYGNRPLGLRMNDVASTVRNCLFHSNSNATGIATGVSLAGGTLENCTIAGNLDSSDGLPPGLRMSKGTAVNNIVWGNGTDALVVGSVRVTGGTFNTNLVDVAVGTGVGNLVADPKLRPRARRPWRPSSASPAIDAGARLGWMTESAVDLGGSPRVRDRAPDLGCYEVGQSGLLMIVR